jgi:hypothetical protein
VEVHERDVSAVRGASLARLVALAWLLVAAASSGCAAGTRQVMAPRYTLTMPSFWQVKSEGRSDGQPTVITIGKPPAAFVDEETSAAGGPAEVEVRIHGWAESASASAGDVIPLRASAELEATQLAASLLARDPDLQLQRHVLIAEQPPECGLAKRKYDLLGVPQEPLDVVSRPGWRVIIVGGKAHGSLLGVVARVPYEQDTGRYCDSLRNLQLHLQNLLDGLKAVVSPVVPPPPPAPDENLDTRPTL